MKDDRKAIEVVTRAKATNGTFQTSLKVENSMDIDSFALWWADRSIYKAVTIKQMVNMIEDGILYALQQGHQVNLNLASFYPRLSGALPARDADPESEMLFVRGAVKARGTLMNGLKEKLVAVNRLSRERARVFDVFDEATKKSNTVVAGHVLSASGIDIAIDQSQSDEGVWLEKKRKRRMDRVAKARIIESNNLGIKFIFDRTPPRGKYFLIVATRSGDGTDYRVRRARCAVKVV